MKNKLIILIFIMNAVKDAVLPIMHCALQKSVAIFLMLKNPVGFIALCNSFASAMSVIKHLFMYLYSKFKETRSTRRNYFLSTQLNTCRTKSKTPGNNRSLAPMQTKTITEACEA